MKTLTVAWDESLWTGKEHLILDPSKLVFCISALEVRLDKLGDDKDKYDLNLNTKRKTCLTLLTQSLLQNGFKLLEELEATPLELVSGINKVPFHGCYLPLSIAGVLIYVKIVPHPSFCLTRATPCGRYD